VGIGFGAKLTRGQVVARECVRVYVKKKLPRSHVPIDRRVPSQVGGLPTDVLELPGLQTQAVPCGVSIGHFRIGAGTLGCLGEKDGRRFVVSNNHVLADCNQAAIGDEIWQPGCNDGGGPPAIAHLSEFEPLNFGPGANAMDAAIAELTDPVSVTPQIRMIGAIGAPPTLASTGMAVKKCGRTTDLTSGHVEGISEDVLVRFGGLGQIYFEDQIAVRGSNGLFSRRGDSGSLIVSADQNRPVALLFAGDTSQGLTYGTPFARILGRFGITVLV